MSVRDTPARKHLFYTEHRGSLVFAPPEIALRTSQIHEALAAETWGEFKAKLPPGELARIEADRDMDPDEEEWEPRDDTRSPGDYVPGFSDGDYPPWLQTLQDEYLPREICQKFGRRESSTLNGAFWTFPAAVERAILVALAERGFQVERRDDLRFW